MLPSSTSARRAPRGSACAARTEDTMNRSLVIVSLSLLAACAHSAPAPSFAFEEAPQSLGSRTADPVALVRPSGHLVELGTEAVAGGKDLFVWHSHGGDDYRRGERVNEVS